MRRRYSFHAAFVRTEHEYYEAAAGPSYVFLCQANAESVWIRSEHFPGTKFGRGTNLLLFEEDFLHTFVCRCVQNDEKTNK